MENLYSVNQIAFILKVHPLSVRRYIKSGKLKAVRFGGSVRVKEDDFHTFVREFVPALSPILPKEKKIQRIKIFDAFDPFFKLDGKGASI